jgi:hypothetical protein
VLFWAFVREEADVLIDDADPGLVEDMTGFVQACKKANSSVLKTLQKHNFTTLEQRITKKKYREICKSMQFFKIVSAGGPGTTCTCALYLFEFPLFFSCYRSVSFFF